MNLIKRFLGMFRSHKALNEIKVTTNHTFSESDINDLVSTALEGGINYWCRKAVIKKDPDGNYMNVLPENQNKVEFASDVISQNGILVLYDAESPDKWELSLENMAKGIETHCTKRNIAPSALMDDYDADDVDCIVQYALFGELVFG